MELAWAKAGSFSGFPSGKFAYFRDIPNAIELYILNTECHSPGLSPLSLCRTRFPQFKGSSIMLSSLTLDDGEHVTPRQSQLLPPIEFPTKNPHLRACLRKLLLSDHHALLRRILAFKVKLVALKKCSNHRPSVLSILPTSANARQKRSSKMRVASSTQISQARINHSRGRQKVARRTISLPVAAARTLSEYCVFL